VPDVLLIFSVIFNISKSVTSGMAIGTLEWALLLRGSNFGIYTDQFRCSDISPMRFLFDVLAVKFKKHRYIAFMSSLLSVLMYQLENRV
jgi:K+-sensing histidine kinase KdpD